MTEKKKVSASASKKSFSYAFNGLFQLIKQEPNAQIHMSATVVALIAAVIRHVGTWQWCALLFAIGLVWITEALNTCIEKLCDYCCENKWDPAIKIIKDVAAAAVLIAAIISAGIGVIVFFF